MKVVFFLLSFFVCTHVYALIPTKRDWVFVGKRVRPRPPKNANHAQKSKWYLIVVHKAYYLHVSPIRFRPRGGKMQIFRCFFIGYRLPRGKSFNAVCWEAIRKRFQKKKKPPTRPARKST